MNELPTESLNMKHLNKFLLLLFFLPFTLIAQQKGGQISGTVHDESGEALIGATILLKDIDKGTIANEEGEYMLDNITPGSHTLTVNFQGYQTYIKQIEVEPASKQQINIVMKASLTQLNEIIVTTQKRSQSNIEVPAAISALAGHSLEKLNITDFDALSQYVPGLQMQLQSPNNPGFVIRGITSDDGDSRVQPRVSVFQDGVSISRSRGAVVELFDMERVEVVKGPQGTLFGRSAQIGAVHLIQNKPTPGFSGEIKLGYGNYNQKLATGFFNTPLKGNQLINRFSFYYNDRDGFIENRSGGTLNGKNALAFRDIIRWELGTRTTADLILNFQHDDYPGTSFKSGTYAPLDGNTDPNTMADLEQGENLGIKRNVGGATLLINHDISNAWSLSSISAFRRFNADESFDADGTAAPALWFSEIAEGNQISQELRFNYDNDSRFSGFFGANFFYEDGSQEVPLRTNEQSAYTLLSGIVATQISSNEYLTDDEKTALISAVYVPMLSDGVPNYVSGIPNIPSIFGSFAGAPLNEYHEESSVNYGTTQAFELFADGTYDLTDQLSLTAGLRGTYENLEGGYRSDAPESASSLGAISGLYPNILSYVTNEKVSVSDDYLSYVGRLALNYMFKRNNVYVSVSRGRRPAVIQIATNLTTASLDTAFLDPEIVWSYEAGVKGSVFNSKLTYDFSTYYYNWDHFQTTVYESGYPVTIDAGKAHSFGIETGLRYHFLNSSSIFANYGYIKGEFDDEDSDGNPQEYAGNTFRLTPEHSFSTGLDLNFRIKPKYLLYLRPNYSYRSKVYFEDDNTEELSQEGYGLLNLNAGIVWTKKVSYTVGFFAKNLTDEQYIIDAGNTGNAFGIPTFIGGTRQTYGIEFKVSF